MFDYFLLFLQLKDETIMKTRLKLVLLFFFISTLSYGEELKNINIEYMYGSQYSNSNTAVVVFRFSDTDLAVRILKDHHISMIDNVKDFNSRA